MANKLPAGVISVLLIAIIIGLLCHFQPERGKVSRVSDLEKKIGKPIHITPPYIDDFEYTLQRGPRWKLTMRGKCNDAQWKEFVSKNSISFTECEVDRRRVRWAHFDRNGKYYQFTFDIDSEILDIEIVARE